MPNVKILSTPLCESEFECECNPPPPDPGGGHGGDCFRYQRSGASALLQDIGLILNWRGWNRLLGTQITIGALLILSPFERSQW